VRGRNSRLDTLQAAVLREKLRHLDAWNDRRREIAAAYDAALAQTTVLAPVESPGRRHVYHLYVVRASGRGAFREALATRGIGSAVHYPIPVHRQPAYADLGPPDETLGVTEQLAGEIVSIPLHPGLDDDDVEYVAEALQAAAV
jgi:dTDP-4-amino-4,6-dideoxygalactose transaminase